MKSMRGTIRYADPEILKKNKYSGEMADIWACGIIFYCLICGDMPFEDDVFGILYKKVLKCDIRIPMDLSKDAKNLIKSILNLNVNERINLQEIKCHPWF